MGKRIRIELNDELWHYIKMYSDFNVDLDDVTNLALSMFFKKNINEDDINGIKKKEMLDKARQKQMRQLIRGLRSTDTDSFFFFSRTWNRIMKILKSPYVSETLKKDKVIQLLDHYIKESETYPDNDEVTDFFVKMQEAIKKSKMSCIKLAKIWDLRVREIDEEMVRDNEIKNRKFRQDW